jgi:D-sedoheptulose 7-phosphate isomerase
MTGDRLQAYLDCLARAAEATEATDRMGRPMPPDEAVEWAMVRARKAHCDGNKLIFIGNGGSAGIASHLAIDYSKNGGIRALAFNDGAALTCLGNDLGYDQVFAKQIALHGRSGDLLVAISSSGRSPNILNAVAAAREADIDVLTLSGFRADNPLRAAGDVNLHVPSQEYGFVEIGHLALGHAILDLAMGWGLATDPRIAVRGEAAA